MAQTRTAKGTVVISAAVSAGSFIVGDDYEIKTVGTTDFTAIGAASNTIGVVFTATGIGSGTGDAYQVTYCANPEYIHVVIEKIGGPRDWGRIDGQRAREDEEIIMFIVTWTEMQS